MKKLILVCLTFLPVFSMAQNFTPNRSACTITVQDCRMRPQLNFYLPHTHGLTFNGGLDTLGMILYEDSSGHIWYRDTVISGGHKWNMVVTPGDITITANNGLYNNAGAIQLGQPQGQSGNPAQLLHNSEIPYNGFRSYSYKNLNNSANLSAIATWDTATSTSIQAPIKIIQKDSTGIFQIFEPWNYGVTYHSGYRPGTGNMTAGRVYSGYTSGASLDAMPDNVYEIFGYNSLPTAGRQDTSDAAIRVAMETNYLNTLDEVTLNFEYHDPEVTLFDGRIFRTDSKYISKKSGYTNDFSFIDNHEYYSVRHPNETYFQILASNGLNAALNLYGFTNGDLPDGDIKFNNTINGAFSEIQSVQGNLFIGNSHVANIANLTFWADGHTWICRSASNDPATWTGLLVGNDSSGKSEAENCSILELQSGGHRGYLGPRMTTVQRLAITGSQEALEVWDTDLHALFSYNGTAWVTGPIAGSFSQVGSATTTFTVTLPYTQAGTSYKVNVTPTAALAAAPYYVNNKTTTSFDVVYLSGITGTVTFDWTLLQ